MNTKQAYDFFHKGILTLADVQSNGICVDEEHCKEQDKILTKEIEQLKINIYKNEKVKELEKIQNKEFNINSPDQLSKLLFKIIGLIPIKYTETDNPSTDAESLEVLSFKFPLVKEISQYRKLKKMRDTYLAGFIRESLNGIMHCNFNLHTVTSYRGSSSNVNFQNIPKHDERANEICRKAIIPRKDHLLLEADYSGIEVRVGACYHEDPAMIKYILNPETDMHRDVASQLFFLSKEEVTKEIRYSAKNQFVFPEFYGSYYVQCAPDLWESLLINKLKKHLYRKGIKHYEHFENHVKKVEYDFWHNRFFKYAEWKKITYNKYKKDGFVDLKTGFRCSGYMQRNDVLNYAIQGSAFHCLLWSLIQLNKVQKKENWNSKIIGQIHDSIIFDVDPTELNYLKWIIKKTMCNDLKEKWKWIIVPLDVEISVSKINGNWYEMEEI